MPVGSFLQREWPRCIAFIIIVGVVLWNLPESYKTLPPISAENAFSVLRDVVAYHLLVIAVFAFGMFSQGRVNKTVSAWFCIVLLLDYFIYYVGHRVVETTYAHNVIGFLAAWVPYLLMSYRVAICRSLALGLGKRMEDKSIARVFLSLAKHTQAELLLIRYKLWHVWLELVTMLYCGAYLWINDVPHDANLYQFILAKGHIDYYPFYELISDILALYLVTVCFRFVRKEQTKPDALI